MGDKASCAKNNYFANLLGGQYLFEIWKSSLTVKTSKNVVKSGCSWKFLR